VTKEQLEPDGKLRADWRERRRRVRGDGG
jgi:hypothetical protein